MTYPIEVKQQAIELRLAGLTLREIEEKLNVSPATISTWTDSTSDDRSDAANARQQRIVQLHQEAHLTAGERLMDRIEHMEDKDLTRAFAATAQANHADLRIIQDKTNSSSLIDAIRQALRVKDPTELRQALADPLFTPSAKQVSSSLNQVIPASTEPLT